MVVLWRSGWWFYGGVSEWFYGGVSGGFMEE